MRAQFPIENNHYRRGMIALSSAILSAIHTFIPTPAKASDMMVGVQCMRMGYTVIDPIYMGRTTSGFDQWACASGSGININGPPFPVVICNGIGQCRHVGWTY